MDKDSMIKLLEGAGFVRQGAQYRRGRQVVDIVNETMYLLVGRVMVDIPLQEITCVQYDREFDDLRIETRDTTHVFVLGGER